MRRRSRRAASLAATALFGGCAGLLAPPETPLPPVSQNTAVVALVDSARAEIASGRAETAAAALERALRIEPRNPSLWHELAKLRLSQGQYAQAEALAQRSNSWARDHRRLRAANFRLIGEARERRGDVAGAQAAYSKAAELEK